MDGRPHGGPRRPAVHGDCRAGDVRGGVGGLPFYEGLVRLATADLLTSNLRSYSGARQSWGNPGAACGLAAERGASVAESIVPRTSAFGAPLLGPTTMTGGVGALTWGAARFGRTLVREKEYLQMGSLSYLSLTIALAITSAADPALAQDSGPDPA